MWRACTRAIAVAGALGVERHVLQGHGIYEAPAHRMNNIRQACPDDAAQLSRLLTDLGFPTTEKDLRERWADWERGDNSCLVVSGHEQLLGAITLHEMSVLHRPFRVGRITALVVDSGARRAGLGRSLVDAAEVELRRRGCGLIEVTSNEWLSEAHAFYQKSGYERTSFRFFKALLP